MARTQGIKQENNFSLGLVTETTELRYPRNSCVDVDNIVINQLGEVSRRLPLDIENPTDLVAPLGPTLTVPQIGKPIVEYVWTSVGGDGDRSFFVLQQGNIITFYDISSTSSNLRGTRKGFSIDLNGYIVSGSSLNPADYPCSFANGRGKLVVVNKAIEPLRITYSATTDTITIASFSIKFRDFEGVPSTIAIDSRPSYSVATALTANPNHVYNLYNQGWNLTDALTQWDAARADLPSLCDTVGTFRASETDAFDNTKVGPKSNGNTLAPRGHFVLTLGQEERTSLSGVDVGGSTSSVGFSNALVSQLVVASGFSSNTPTTSIPNAIANANDTVLTTTATARVTLTPSAGNINSGTIKWQMAKTFSAPTKIFSVAIRANSGASTLGYIGYKSDANLTNITTKQVKIYGVNGALTSTLGTLLGTYSYANSINEIFVVTSTDNLTPYDHIQITVEYSTPTYASAVVRTHDINLASVEVYTAAIVPLSYSRPEITSFFGGRIWYGASGYNEKGTLLYFSQVLERDEQFGACYQINDPTSEYFFDLLASDGGTVSIPEIANVVGLFPMRSALVVLATNGVWVIRGSSSEGFSATSYRVEKVTSIGCVSRYSVCDMRGLPVWMGEDGVYTLEYDPNYNAFQIKSLSNDRIRTYIKDKIFAVNKRYSKIVYDTTKEMLRITYNSSASVPAGQEFYYDRILNYDINSKAWYPWSFPTIMPLVGLVNLVDSNHVYPAVLKFIFWSSFETYTGTYFAELREDAPFKDFVAVSTYTVNPGLAADYTSFIVTAPMLDAEAMKFFQTNYVMVFMNTVAGSSCKLQAQFDWTTSGNSGKWSTSQEIYLNIPFSRVGYRKLKFRGKGRALSFKFISTGTGPFELLGWSIFETANSGV